MAMRTKFRESINIYKGDATESHIVWSHQKGAPNTPSPIVVGNDLYFVSDSGIATCLV